MGIVIFILVLFFFFRFLFKKYNDNSTYTYTEIPKVTEKVEIKSVVEPKYKKKYKVMNNSEEAFFFALNNQIPDGYYIFPKMRIADMIDPIHGQGFYNRRNQILPKHIDFLVCNKNFKPLVAIEINGSSHYRKDRIDRDEQVKQIFKEAGIPLEFIRVGSNFFDAINNIKLYL